MYQMDLSNKSLIKLDSTILKDENLLERRHLQQCIFNSWENFKNDIGYPGAILLGQEIKPHDSVQDSIDLLAFDQNDGCLIVVELKRSKDKLQLLQAISYASMVATWDSEKLINVVAQKKMEENDEILDFVKEYETNKNVKIVLIAESFDPEVILASDWLSSFGLEITAFSIELHKIENKILMDIDQKYPLSELSEAYETRLKQTSKILNQDITWNDIIPKLEYSFAKQGIEFCKKVKGNDGDPKRRRFVHVIKNYRHCDLISFNFRQKYLNIYIDCKEKELCTNEIKSIMGPDIEITYWRDGINFNIDKEDSYEKFLKWLRPTKVST